MFCVDYRKQPKGIKKQKMGQFLFCFGFAYKKEGHFLYFVESQIKKQIFVRRGGVGKGCAAVEGFEWESDRFQCKFSIVIINFTEEHLHA